MQTKTSSTLLSIGIAGVQLFDIIIHVATNQLEPIRVASNVLILLWLGIVASGRIKAQFTGVTGALLGGYLGLNLFFLATAGLTNPEQGDAPRIMLFVLIILTLALSAWLAASSHKQR